jgi:hypothetical protein
MDPSHTAKLDDVRDQVIQDIRTQSAWDAAVAQADSILTAARSGDGLLSAAQHHQPPLAMTTTDFFNASEVGVGKATIPTVRVSPESMRALAAGSVQLLSMPTAEGRPASEVELPADRELAVIELQNTRADWLDQTDQLARQSYVGNQLQLELAQKIEYTWAMFDTASKRTNYQEVAKQ